MAALGGLAIGLSIIFGGFVVVLLAELYYVFYWKRRRPWSRKINSVATEYQERGNNFAREAAMVGSFGGYSSSVTDPEIVAKLFPISPEAIGSNSSLYMQGVLGGPKLLFTIKEETKEDMEYEEPVTKDSDSKQFSQQQWQATFKSICSESPSPKKDNHHHPYHFQQQRHFAYSIGLIQQQQNYYSRSTAASSQQKMLAESPAAQKHVSFHSSSDSSPVNFPFSSESFPCSPPRQSASLSSPSWRSSSSSSSSVSSPWQNMYSESPTSRSRPTSNDQHNVFISNPIYEASSHQRSITPPPKFSAQTTPFATPVSSPSLLENSETPPLTPPLTPIKAPLAPYSIPLTTPVLNTTSFFRKSTDSLSSSSKCSSPL